MPFWEAPMPLRPKERIFSIRKNNNFAKGEEIGMETIRQHTN